MARAKLRIDARKWIAAKMKPRVYGEKLDLTGKPELTFDQRVIALANLEVPPHAPMPMGS